MTYTVIDGRAIADVLRAEVVREVACLDAAGQHCGLATVRVGDDYGSAAYQRRIDRLAIRVGVAHRPLCLPGGITGPDLHRVVDELDRDPDVSGVLVLRPLPEHIDEASVFRAIAPRKDVEAVHPENAGLLALGVPRFVPSTAAAAFHVLDRWLDDAGEDRAEFYHRARVVVVGRSNNVGKPAVSIACARQAAVTSIDEWASRTGGLGRHTRRADVLVVAAGVPGLIRAEHVRQGAVVLDIGINPVPDPATGRTRIVGDVAFDEVALRTRAITPVPGGIGPVTDVLVVRNAVAAARLTCPAGVPTASAGRGAR